jgi:hypothetical protein
MSTMSFIHPLHWDQVVQYLRSLTNECVTSTDSRIYTIPSEETWRLAVQYAYQYFSSHTDVSVDRHQLVAMAAFGLAAKVTNDIFDLHLSFIHTSIDNPYTLPELVTMEREVLISLNHIVYCSVSSERWNQILTPVF